MLRQQQSLSHYCSLLIIVIDRQQRTSRYIVSPCFAIVVGQLSGFIRLRNVS
jgi:hypothetical protein